MKEINLHVHHRVGTLLMSVGSEAGRHEMAESLRGAACVSILCWDDVDFR